VASCVWRWPERFIEDGFDGLLRDKTRPSRIKPLGPEAAERVVALTLSEPPGKTTQMDRGVDGESDGAQREFGPSHLARSPVRAQLALSAPPGP
jgi:hypothetical protein